MLALKLKPGEKIYIGNAEVNFLRNKKGAIQIGINAPKEIIIEREKIRDKRLQTKKDN